MTVQTKLFTIGDVAETCDVTVAAIRYYEEVGLLTPTTRVGGKRRFDDSVFGRIDFIRRAQVAGFSLEEIRTLLTGSDRWQELVSTRLAELHERRKETDALIQIFEEIQQCSCSAVLECGDHGPAPLARPDAMDPA